MTLFYNITNRCVHLLGAIFSFLVSWFPFIVPYIIVSFLIECMPVVPADSRSAFKVCFFIVFYLIVSFHIVEMLVEPADSRSAFTIAVTPFINWFNKLKEVLALLPKNSLMGSLLNFFKLYLSLLMAVIFFVMYTAHFTLICNTIFRILVLLSPVMSSVIQHDLYINPEGPLSLDAYSAVILFRYFTASIVFINISCLIIAACAKIPFLRYILKETVGSLSYKFYVGEGKNPETQSSILWVPLLKLVGLAVCTIGFTAVIIIGFTACLDAIIASRNLTLINNLANLNGTPLTNEEKLDFLRNRTHIYTTVANTIYTVVYASKQ